MLAELQMLVRDGVRGGLATFETEVPSWEAWGGGVGRAAMEALIEESKRAGIWTLQTTIFPENDASLSLHRAVGFRVVGVRERVGRRDGLWRDTVLMERRSEVYE